MHVHWRHGLEANDATGRCFRHTAPRVGSLCWSASYYYLCGQIYEHGGDVSSLALAIALRKSCDSTCDSKLGWVGRIHEHTRMSTNYMVPIFGSPDSTYRTKLTLG